MQIDMKDLIMRSVTVEDLISFGNYLLSPERRALYEQNPMFPDGLMLEERLLQTSHADFENWLAAVK